jgi:hypothetical protein
MPTARCTVAVGIWLCLAGLAQAECLNSDEVVRSLRSVAESAESMSSDRLKAIWPARLAVSAGSGVGLAWSGDSAHPSRCSASFLFDYGGTGLVRISVSYLVRALDALRLAGELARGLGPPLSAEEQAILNTNGSVLSKGDNQSREIAIEGTHSERLVTVSWTPVGRR